MQKPAPVKKGQRVAQGTRIGAVGNTGYSTGPHLHFTVYKNGKLIDPETVLKH
jgi:murein DD-endopeptidase MepM/ murein hydrolase activator NlpD